MRESRKLRKKEFEIKGDEYYKSEKEKKQKKLDEYIEEQN